MSSSTSSNSCFALVRGVDVRHAHLVAGSLGTLVGFAVDGLEITEDAVSGAWASTENTF